MDPRRPLHVALLMLVSLCPNIVAPQNVDFFNSPATCSDDAECVMIHKHAVCIPFIQPRDDPDNDIVTMGTANLAENDDNVTMTTMTSEPVMDSVTTEPVMDPVTTKRCRCNSDYGYHLQGNTCVKPVGIGAECQVEGAAVCRDENSMCVSDGSNTDRFRCVCKTGYLSVYVGGHDVCAVVLTKRDDINCTMCEHNEGRCYDMDGDGRRDGCVCPNTRSGTDCSTVHVTVHCDVDKFQMTVCYQNEVTSSGLNLHVTGRDNDELCKGRVAPPSDTYCSNDDIKLVLDLHGENRHRCGTREITNIPNVRMFENTLTAAPDGPVISPKDSQTFTAFCKFATRAETVFQGVDVNGVPGNDRGQHKLPNLSLHVENNLGDPIPRGVAVYLGDRVRLVISVMDDGTYGALRVEQVTASSSPVIPDPKAVVMPLTVDSCPSTRQTILTARNNWRQKGDQVNVVETGLMNMFKMRRGLSVYIHCVVKLCLKGSEDECKPVMCTTGVPHRGQGRRRRAVDGPGTATVSRQLMWVDPANNAAESAGLQDSAKDTPAEGNVVMSVSGFGALMTILVVILMVFVILTGLLVMRLRRTSGRDPIDSIPEKPQRFALPRIDRNTFRI